MKLAAPLFLALAIGAGAATDGAHALTLGRAQGVPLVGRPLDVSVPVTLDGPSDAMPECVQADVFYGDTRLARDRVTSEVQPAPSGAVVRLRAQAAVNEPVVTVYVQLGCTNRFTRRLVLFTEQPDADADRAAEARAAARPALPAVVPASPPSSSAPAPAANLPAAGARRGRAAAEGRPAAVGARTEGARTEPRPAATVAKAPQPARTGAATRAPRATQGGAGAARLKLEPLDLSPTADPRLRITDGMAAPGPANDQQRALAIALWKALNAQPEDLLRDAQRLQALESDLRSLRQSMRRNEAALVEMRGQLHRAEQERYFNPLVYLLAVLLLVAAGAAAWFWRRARTPAAQWWKNAAEDSESDLDASGVDAAPPTGMSTMPLAATGPANAVGAGEPVSQAGSAGRGEGPEANKPAPAAARPAPATGFGFSPSINGDFQGSAMGVRALKAEELHDVQQEADFFVSLGEYDRAVDLLRSHIAANPQTSAVTWLDLLNIFHLLGRRSDYDGVRREFQGLFNAEIPAFEHYSDSMPGLEDYPAALSRICALWPHPRVLEVIEESIFRGPKNDDLQAFSLEAYRELLMLHHIGTETLVDQRDDEPVRLPSFTGGGPDGSVGETPPSGFAATSISPLSTVATGAGRARELKAEAELPEAGLDIDLGEFVADEPLIGAGAAIPVASGADDAHQLDFDLPDDFDTSAFPTKKTRG